VCGFIVAAFIGTILTVPVICPCSDCRQSIGDIYSCDSSSLCGVALALALDAKTVIEKDENGYERGLGSLTEFPLFITSMIKN
jgi:hypothetical protein